MKGSKQWLCRWGRQAGAGGGNRAGPSELLASKRGIGIHLLLAFAPVLVCKLLRKHRVPFRLRRWNRRLRRLNRRLRRWNRRLRRWRRRPFTGGSSSTATSSSTAIRSPTFVRQITANVAANFQGVDGEGIRAIATCSVINASVVESGSGFRLPFPCRCRRACCRGIAGCRRVCYRFSRCRRVVYVSVLRPHDKSNSFRDGRGSS